MEKGEGKKSAHEAEDWLDADFDEAHINVIPLEVDDASGEVLCEMVPTTSADAMYLRNGHLRLPRGRPVQVHFHLQPGDNDDTKALQFEVNPWAFKLRECPGSSDNESKRFPEAKRENSKHAWVKAPDKGKHWGHFRLNFELGKRWDPIIIRD